MGAERNGPLRSKKPPCERSICGILPLAMLMYFFCYIDRINVSFAALTDEQGYRPGRRGPTVSVPGHSTRLRHVRGPQQPHHGQGRRAAVAGADHDHLGPGLGRHRRRRRTEQLPRRPLPSGRRPRPDCSPGIVLLFTYWFPDAHRARIIVQFTLALPVSVALGAPVSTAILGMDGMLGVKGWQWIYIMEAIPTMLIGFFVLVAMTDRPAKATWLTDRERTWLMHHPGARTPRGGVRRQVQRRGRRWSTRRSCCCR